VREGQASHDADIPFSGPSPSDEAFTAEIQRAAAVAVSGLPPKRQEVFRLVREEGLTHKEVAAVMGISTQTVANQMSKALAELRSALEPYIDLDPQGRGEAE
jgi:RNA polymerase sigma-70 factor (ECF subfamily)